MALLVRFLQYRIQLSDCLTTCMYITVCVVMYTFPFYSSVIDVTNITQPDIDIELKPNDGKLSRRWLSIYVMYFTMFLGAVSKFQLLVTLNHHKVCLHSQ